MKTNLMLALCLILSCLVSAAHAGQRNLLVFMKQDPSVIGDSWIAIDYTDDGDTKAIYEITRGAVVSRLVVLEETSKRLMKVYRLASGAILEAPAYNNPIPGALTVGGKRVELPKAEATAGLEQLIDLYVNQSGRLHESPSGVR